MTEATGPAKRLGLVLLPSEGDDASIALWAVLVGIVVAPIVLGVLWRLWDRRRRGS